LQSDNRVSAAGSATHPGFAIEVRDLSKRVGDGLTVLDRVSFQVEPGELVAIVGGSGAGKTTLLEAVAGVRLAEEGSVRFDGVDLYERLGQIRPVIGYVPQDDIIHLELPVERTLRYAAQLRMAPSRNGAAAEEAVRHAIAALDLTGREHVRVEALSGGQRKRTSIAVELLTDPRVFFLDEPTSGLDPATSAQLLKLLRRLSDEGRTIVFTTHSVQDLASCDKVIFLAPGGRLAFAGPLDEALAHFGVRAAVDVYELLADEEIARDPIAAHGNAAGGGVAPAAPPEDEVSAARPGALRQWAVMTRRTFETMARNRLTLAILLGSPALVVAMFAVLFQPGAFDFADPSPSATVMIIFWVTFGAFFFGLTYGLLQIVTELPVLRRERLIGINLGSYLMSKVAVLLPFLLFVVVLMLGILRALDRLPAAGLETYASLGVTLSLAATAALAMGLLASAAVSTPAQATLALPMLCFPAVLFSGAILPVNVMANVGQWLSALMIDRWAFEAVGRELGLRELFAEGGSDLGPPLLEAYGDAGTSGVGTYWLILATFVVVLLVAAWLTLRRRARPGDR
jgi:ABC-type multidrug transport system ATPase subunit